MNTATYESAIQYIGELQKLWFDICSRDYENGEITDETERVLDRLKAQINDAVRMVCQVFGLDRDDVNHDILAYAVGEKVA